MVGEDGRPFGFCFRAELREVGFRTWKAAGTSAADGMPSTPTGTQHVDSALQGAHAVARASRGDGEECGGGGRAGRFSEKSRRRLDMPTRHPKFRGEPTSFRNSVASYEAPKVKAVPGSSETESMKGIVSGHTQGETRLLERRTERQLWTTHVIGLCLQRTPTMRLEDERRDWKRRITNRKTERRREQRNVNG
eukprot:scaffold300_cov258-Pinguiococcus_pyrenoidosus.AAC.58